MIKYFAILLFLTPLYNCQPEKSATEKVAVSTAPNAEIKESENIVINKIEPDKIGKRITDVNQIAKLKTAFKTALSRQIERPQMWDLFVSENDSLMQFFPYQNFEIGKDSFSSFIIKVPYEDASYESILLINDKTQQEYNSFIVYENLQSEENYHRFTKINGDLLNIEMKSGKTTNQVCQVKNGLFLDYLDAPKVDKEWGGKEKTKTGSISEYFVKGQTANHLKDKYWIEKRFVIEYGKSVITDGNYINGLKDGEWNYSPDGPVDKIITYKNGKVISEKLR